MERYKKYKNSGVEWIGEIPVGWEVKKLKYVAFNRPSNIDKKSNDEETEVSLCNYINVYKNEFITSELQFMQATATQEQKEKFLLQKGDILTTKDSESPNDIAIPALVVEDLDSVVCGYHLTHIKPKKILGSYLFRYFQSNYLKSYFEVSANGVTRYGLGVDKFSSALILNPSENEQTAIAKFLDRKTAEIDELIAQKERLLALYEEEKTAIINHAVTKGLDPNAKLKDSGVEWIGEIPSGWYISTVGRIGQLGRGRVISNIEIKENSGSYPVYSSQTKNGGVMGYLGSYDFDGEYVLWTTDGANAGTVTRRVGRFNCTNVCGTLQPKNWDEIDLRFLPYFLNLGTTFSVRLDINPKLMNGMMAKIPLVLPPKEEQTTIVQHIETETARIDAKIVKTQRIIELQKECRSALISEVVTGKIKVSHLADEEVVQ